MYVKNKYVSYRQIQIVQIRGIEATDNPNVYLIELENYESYDELEAIQTSDSRNKQAQKETAEYIRALTQIELDLQNLDLYMRKRKELKEKHIGAFEKLFKKKSCK